MDLNKLNSILDQKDGFGGIFMRAIHDVIPDFAIPGFNPLITHPTDMLQQLRDISPQQRQEILDGIHEAIKSDIDSGFGIGPNGERGSIEDQLKSAIEKHTLEARNMGVRDFGQRMRLGQAKGLMLGIVDEIAADAEALDMGIRDFGQRMRLGQANGSMHGSIASDARETFGVESNAELAAMIAGFPGHENSFPTDAGKISDGAVVSVLSDGDTLQRLAHMQRAGGQPVDTALLETVVNAIQALPAQENQAVHSPASPDGPANFIATVNVEGPKLG